MTKTQRQYKWFRNHPYVKEWRELDQNSIHATSVKINREWNVGPDGVSFVNIDVIITRYLRLLLDYIRERLGSSELRKSGLIRTGIYFKNRFDLNDTETRFIVQRIY